MKRFFSLAVAATVATLALFASNASLVKGADDADKPAYDALAESKADDAKYEWTYLFDGKTLKNWVDLEDAGAEKPVVEDGALVLGMGASSTSIKFDEEAAGFKLPRENYELEIVSRREMGTDFFSATTFPIGDACVTLINGGWGGAVLGISSVDDMDASQNSTTSYYNFKNDKWYRFRIQVTKRTLRVWIDGEKEIDYVVEGRRLGTRFEVSRCEPLGLTSWISKGVVKVVRFRSLTDAELKEMNERADEDAKFFQIGN
ncbi:MAG: DUF1080 domain-containing protein [Thermoguttaceae bacterium]|nr:DUF1080 domain-containing protein [Thermoguttaceae bacterium]